MRGTSANFRHAKDVCITRSNIEQEQIRREGEGRKPLDAAGVVRAFISMPEDRHYRRAERLMK